MSTRVYVTGVGLLSPIGNTMSDFTESLRAGSSGFRAIPYFDTAAFPFDRGAVITEFPAELTTLVAEHPEWETAEHYGVHCAAVALADAGFAVEALDPFRTAVVVASSNAGVETNHTYAQQKLRDEVIPGATVVRTPATVTATIRRAFGLRGPQAAVSTACAAGSNAVGRAYDFITTGQADVAIAGGAEPFSMLSFSGFTLLKSLTHDAVGRSTKGETVRVWEKRHACSSWRARSPRSRAARRSTAKSAATASPTTPFTRLPPIRAEPVPFWRSRSVSPTPGYGRRTWTTSTLTEPERVTTTPWNSPR